MEVSRLLRPLSATRLIRVSRTAADLGCAVILAVKPLLLETPRYERYQNELASQLAGVPSSAASTKGLPLLRLLLATAPPLDAPIIFLPQQRTMFLIQAMQRWIGSDDDLEEEILASVAELFLHLAPIVQELSGSHWELVFDVVESNLEVGDLLPQLRAALIFHLHRLRHGTSPSLCLHFTIRAVCSTSSRNSQPPIRS